MKTRAGNVFAAVAGVLLIVAMCGGGFTASAASVAYPCADGFIQIEDQAWWQDRTGEDWPGRHVHQQMCWPGGVVTGTISIPIRVLLHAQPDGAHLTRVRATDGGGATLWSQTTGLGTPDANGDQTINVTMTIATAGLSSGVHEIRVASVVSQPSGAQQFVSSAHPLYVRSLSGGTSRNWHEARGWYTGFEYENARTRTRLTTGIISQPWSLDTQCAAPSGAPVTGCSVWLDPDAHNGNPGTPLLPLVNGPSRRTAVIDGLASGLHKIAIKTDSTGNRGGQDGTDSGLFVLTVLVPGTPSSTATPTVSPTLPPAPSTCAP